MLFLIAAQRKELKWFLLELSLCCVSASQLSPAAHGDFVKGIQGCLLRHSSLSVLQRREP